MNKRKVLHICSFKKNKLNGIKTVLEQIISIQKEKIDAKLINLEDKIKIEEMKLNKYDLIIFHGIYDLNYLIISKKIKKYEIPYIIVPHCSLTKISLKQSKIKKKIFNFFATSFYKNASAIAFLNKEEEENSIIVNPKIMYLPNGNIMPKQVEKLKVESNLAIMYLSRIDIYHKGLDLLLESLYLIKNELLEKKIIFNFYGDGNKKNMKKFLKKLEKYDLEELIYYKGKVEGDSKDRAFRENDIFILTSRFEGFPMAVLEALSYGLPCILTEGTNMKSIIEKYNSGWICKTDVNEISKNILKAIDEYSSNKNKYRQNSFMNANEYSWNKIIEKHLIEYEKIIRKVNYDIL